MFALTPPFPWLIKDGEDEAGVSDDSGFAAPVPMSAPTTELLFHRLRNQKLINPERRTPAQVVAWLGAMQAQDFAAAKWGIGLRARGCQNAEVDEAFNDGAILRTHVLRPTWHLVAPADIRWMLELSAPRVHAANAYYYRQSNLDAKIFAKSCAMIHRTLEGGQALTRAELAVYLKRAKIPADGLKLAYLMMHAELEGVICSGPRRGNQFTYALLEERAPNAKTMDRQDALVELTKRYFLSHGPATVRDFAWWSGLTAKEVQDGIEAVKPELHESIIDGRTHWSAGADAVAPAKGTSAFLLPNYDEYLIAYKDREPLLGSGGTANIVARSNGAFANHLVIEGRLAGSWARTVKGNTLLIEVAPYKTLTAAQSRAVSASAECYGEFLGLPVTLSVV